ncbi:hypothetical protein Csp2054_06740 [Curtobacterium sp. 'Ferrero']|uniref:cell division protein PerM n=1 Tax=Curtobacterium sp. 'Ferrero' TaxID=2033654 RepID=UPI000BC3CB28|nr:DUF6350 family protein [Curtobacterium sp. 'Ferrero']PCN48402.1 hypothetical protein Csp2054_06740 [Curtobacterium sp. 'Ferrero']
MNRLGTAVLAAIEGIVTVGVGVGIALVPLTLLWGFEYGLQVDWDVFWKATGSVWLVGHGVDVTFVLGSATAKASGVSGASAPIHVTVAALGFAIVTAWLGARAGRRFAETAHRTTGVLVGTAVVAVLGLLIALSSTSTATQPSTWQAVVLPALWFGIPAFAASELCRVRRMLPADAVSQRAIDLVQRIPAVWRAVIAFGLRAGTAVTAVVVGIAGVVVAFLLFGSFAEVITLYERSHAGVVGGVALTVGQLAFVPDLVGWATAWLVGPGFAIGTGSSVSPIGTALGPIPGLPVFGALPASGHTFGLVWVLVPVVAGFAVAGMLRPRLVRALGAQDSALYRALGGVAAGVVAGVLTGGVAWLSSGSFGPGRLADVGPDGLVVGLVAALEVGVPAAVALAIGSDLVRLPARRERWTETEDDPVEPEESLLAALDRAGAVRSTDSHRFVVRETHGAHGVPGEPDEHSKHDEHDEHHEHAEHAEHLRVAGAGPSALTEPITDDDAAADAPPARRTGLAEPSRASRSAADAQHPAGPDAAAAAAAAASDPDADVALPDWARTDAVASERVTPTPAAGPQRARTALRDRLRDAAGDVRDRAGALRDRVTGADAEAQRRPVDDEPLPTAPGTEPQPAFPWSTEEFVAGRDDVDDDAATAPAASAPARPGWDATDQIPEDELPWWRRPKSE